MTDENAFAEWWNAAGTARRRECALNLQAENARLRAEITRLESLISAPREPTCVCGKSHPYPLSAPKEPQ
jgi:hypothetical protein